MSGKIRKRDQDKGCALAGKSTLNRLELTPLDADAASRYKKIVADIEGMDDLLVDLFLEAYDNPTGALPARYKRDACNTRSAASDRSTLIRGGCGPPTAPPNTTIASAVGVSSTASGGYCPSSDKPR